MKTFIKNIINSNKKKHSKDLVQANSVHYTFILKYQNNIIGKLCYDGNEWSFNYTDWFINQNELKPLFEFPVVDKGYKSKDLWPFFESRIPSIKQPKVQNYIEEHPTHKDNLVKLLEVFGNTSVNNPYKLVNLV